MKYAHKILLSSLALGSALAFAQTTEASPTAEPASETAVEAAKPAEPAVQPPSLLNGTELAGEVNGFIKADASPYLVTGDIVVSPNKTLVIEPGVIFYFKPGTGLVVQNAQLVIAGSKISPVQFRSAYDRPTAGDWKGITITDGEAAEIRYLQISDAAAGIAIENGSASIENAQVSNTSRGVYARNASVSISDSKFQNNEVALHVSNYAIGKLERSQFDNNKVALLNDQLAELNASSVRSSGNDVGVVNMGNTQISFSNTSIENNKVGIASAEVLSQDLMESVKNNELDISSEAAAAISVLPPAPEISGTESRPLVASDKISDILNNREEALATNDTAKKSWTILGNVTLGGAYHIVSTSKNDSDEDDVIGTDTIAPGSKYKNNFQVPGLAGMASAYLYMQSPEGKTIEFNTDMTMDSWNHFSPNPVTLRYSDIYNKVTLGDAQLTGGDIYMSGIPLFGADYTLSLLKNNANQPLFQLNGFFGEAKRSLVEGARHPTLYNDYIEDGELQAQRLAYGGFIKWAPLRRFDAKFGVIYASDELEDPLLRDGASSSWTTSDPMQKSLTMYADGNWLFFPGDIELNGQIAVGRADTSDVTRQRAINKVFEDANISTSAYSLLRRLMQNQNRINSLSDAELQSIFGDNSVLSRTKMRDSLRVLISEAKAVQKEVEEDRDEDRVLGLNWGSQNFAIGASLNWNIFNTSVNGHIKYVGEDFYSAGSPDQLADTREFGGRIEQVIKKFWTLGVNYELNIENAAKDDKTNIFGLGEGTEWGLFSKDEGSWYDNNELSNDRTKYIQNAGLDNTFKVKDNLELFVAYNFEYKCQYRPFQLHGDYILEDGIYRDDWFDARKDRDTTVIVNNGDTAYVDAERWAEYMSLANEPFLATRFQERLFKHTWELGATVRAFKSIFKINGRWTYRTDGSVFHRDSLIEDIDFSDATWGKLGYYFGGSDFFEQSYPITVTTTLPKLQNRFNITPRFKNYNRDDMSEFEISVEDEFEMPFKNKFFLLGINAQFRYMSTEWDEEDESFDETEVDVVTNVNFRVNHTSHLYSEWFAGTGLYFRPDNLSDEYKDIYFGVNVNYVF